MLTATDERPSLTDPATTWERRLLLWALPLMLVLAALDAAVLRPGFSAYDEESQLDLIQAWREGMPLQWRYAFGCVHRAMIAGLFGALGPNEAWLRLPAMLALVLQVILLFAWLKPRLGERAALWACLADLVCTATFANARSMVSPSMLSAVFLAHAVVLERLRRPWHHALFGLSLILWTLDYEGWLVALTWLLLAWAWSTRRAPDKGWRWAGLLLGLGAGAAWVVHLSPSFGDYAVTRVGVSGPRQGVLALAWDNLTELLGHGHRLAFSAADLHPWPGPWIWPLCLAGALPLWRRFRAAWGLVLVGSAPLVLQLTSEEPHRMALALLGLAAMAGAGAAWLWRYKVAQVALPLLLVAGAGYEGWAWTHNKLHVAYAYGRSQNLEAAARWMKAAQGAQGWELLDGLGPYNDGSFRLLLDLRRVPHQGGTPVALVHWDYLPALKGLKGQVIAMDSSDYLPLYLYLPAPDELPRLRALHQELAPLQRLSLSAYPLRLQEAALARLHDRTLTDPWARTVYWEAWMHANMMLNTADPAMAKAAAREPLVSGWAFDALAHGLEEKLPQVAQAFYDRADAADPRRASLPYRYLRY